MQKRKYPTPTVKHIHRSLKANSCTDYPVLAVQSEPPSELPKEKQTETAFFNSVFVMFLWQKHIRHTPSKRHSEWRRTSEKLWTLWWTFLSPEMSWSKWVNVKEVLHSQLHWTVWNNPTTHQKHQATWFSAAPINSGVCYQVLLCLRSSKLCPLAPFMHTDNIGKLKRNTQTSGEDSSGTENSWKRLVCDER